MGNTQEKYKGTRLLVAPHKLKEPATIIKGRPKIRLLAIDGGGIRGVVPLRILHEIEAKTGKQINQLFDVIVGTSTGAFVTTMLSIPTKGGQILPANKVMDLYKESGQKIFAEHHLNKFFDKLLSFSDTIKRAANAVGDVFEPKYANTGIKDLFSDNFDTGLKIKDAVVPIGLVTTFKNTNEALMLNSHMSQADVQCHNMSLENALLCSSAAPTYFPSIEIKNEEVQPRSYFNSFENVKFNEEQFIFEDGGCMANNPTWHGIEYVQFLMDLHLVKEYDLEVVSVGTGIPADSPKTEKNEGYLRFAQDLKSDPMSILRGVIDTHFKVRKQIFDDKEAPFSNYYRLEPIVTQYQADHMDDASDKNINGLIESADTFLKNNQELISALIGMLGNDSHRLESKVFHHKTSIPTKHYKEDYKDPEGKVKEPPGCMG